jgi:hypothetical protein
MIMALSAVAALLIGLFNSSATVTVLHYPHPEQSIVEQTLTTSNPQSQDLPNTPRIRREETPAKRNGPEKKINDSRVLFAKAETAERKLEIKNKRERLLNKPEGFASRREKPKVLARLHNNYERPNYYGNALGYAEETRIGPQRLFSNW